MARARKATCDEYYKVLLIGNRGVPKTKLLHSIEEAREPRSSAINFVSTIGIDFKIKYISLNGKNIKLQIWDTATQ